MQTMLEAVAESEREMITNHLRYSVTYERNVRYAGCRWRFFLLTAFPYRYLRL